MLKDSKIGTEKEKCNTKEQGDDAMSNGMMSYAMLDLHALGKKNIKIVSSQEALDDVIPIAWGEDVLQGKEKVIAAKGTNKEYATDV